MLGFVTSTRPTRISAIALLSQDRQFTIANLPQKAIAIPQKLLYTVLNALIFAISVSKLGSF
jgi:hypothetical protein